MSSPSPRATRLAAVVLAASAVLLRPLSTVLPVSAAGRSVPLKRGIQQLAGPRSGGPAPDVVRSRRGWSCGQRVLTLGSRPAHRRRQRERDGAGR